MQYSLWWRDKFWSLQIHEKVNKLSISYWVENQFPNLQNVGDKFCVIFDNISPQELL